MKYPFALLLVFCLFSVSTQKPFNLHSHNDYEQKVPFWTAFGTNKPSGITSIKAEVILQNDTLFVPHDAKGMNAENTLTSLYLEPLKQVMATSCYQKFNVQLLIEVLNLRLFFYP